MDLSNKKCVIIINDTLPIGVVANIASVLSITIGNKLPGLVGQDTRDRQGILHTGLTQLPIPILGANLSKLKALANELGETKEAHDLFVDFTGFAAKAKTYTEYQSLLQNADENEMVYHGIAVLTDKKALNKLTKELKLIGN